MLAIAAKSFHKPSETFIRDHVRIIAPGHAVLVCRDGREADRLGCPTIANVGAWRPPVGLRERAIKKIRKGWRKYVSPQMSRADRQRVVSFLRRHNVRVLLAEFLPVGVLFPHACEEAGVALYVHAHGVDASKLVRKRRWVRHYKALFPRCAGIIVPSRFLADKLALIGCPAEKLHVSPNGIDPTRFRPTARLPFRVIAVGRLVEKKAPHLTIRAFAEVARRFPEARLDMIGDGPLMDRCRALVEEHGLATRVRLHGAQPSNVVARFMAEASLFVQHSVVAPNGDTEGMPVSIIEAMASALPVLSTRHSGIPEVVLEGETGLLVDEHDVSGMAEVMVTLLGDTNRARAMGEAGRRRILANFTHDHARDRLRAIMGLPPFTGTSATLETTGLD